MALGGAMGGAMGVVHTKCNNFIHKPAVGNVHIASTPAEHQYNFHTYLGSTRTPTLFT